MKTKTQLEQEIIDITVKIHQDFPQLSKYIADLPGFFSGTDKDQIGTKNFKEHYSSLAAIVAAYTKTHGAKKLKKGAQVLNPVGYPLYPASEDMYHRGQEERDLNPENVSENKTPNEKKHALNEEDFNEDMTGGDLDIPGSELDDEREYTGNEDEENNGYSLGGDDHNNLDEDNG